MFTNLLIQLIVIGIVLIITGDYMLKHDPKKISKNMRNWGIGLLVTGVALFALMIFIFKRPI